VTTTKDQTVAAGHSGGAGTCTCPGPGPTPQRLQAAWVAGDQAYGANPKLRVALEARGTGYVLSVACDDHVSFGGATHPATYRADSPLRQIPGAGVAAGVVR
jgi:hypothetical protein